jgi:uncharacterized FAD-dependent dehydrogenase
MGNRFLSLKIPTDFTSEELREAIKKSLRIQDFRWQIEKQSLDARKRQDIHWQLQLIVHSDEIQENEYSPTPVLEIPYAKRKEKIAIIGSGPAGFFSAYCLQKAGFSCTIFERGSELSIRANQITDFERKQDFNPEGNYAFGEGGAGSFSDGKLSSRSKHIKAEKAFVIDTYIQAGAPEEISYLSKPHLGSDNLKIIIKNLRNQFLKLGGKILFTTKIEDISKTKTKELCLQTQDKEYLFDYLIVASGHSAYDTYKMLIKKGFAFRPKAFAIGFRAEHLQKTINLAQWGSEKLAGLKAADYALTYKAKNGGAVYSFCMCPGGRIIPATAFAKSNIVNGMSNYSRNGKYANAAIVAALDLRKHLGQDLTALEALDWLKKLEEEFYADSSSYDTAGCTIKAFVKGKTENVSATSFPFSLYESDIMHKMPFDISTNIKEALIDFSKKIRNYDSGNLIGLETKTSSPIQAIRTKDHLFEGEENVFICGEASGFSGGIISSAADGVKTAMHLINMI